MKNPVLRALALVAALALAPVLAHANYVVRDGNGQLITICSISSTGALVPCHAVLGADGLTIASPSNPVPVTLPSGAATSSNQATGNASLNSIDTKTPSFGQAPKASSVPVTLPTDPDIRIVGANITAADVGSTTVTGQSGVVLVTGTPTVNSFITWTTNGASSVTIGVSGTFVATANVEESADCSVFGPATAKILGYNTAAQVTGPGVFRVDATGMACVRLRVPSGNYTSGTIAALANASSSSGLTQVLNPVAIRGADGVTQATTSNPLPTSVQSGNIGGYSFQLSPTITVQNAAYSIGNSLGGLVTLTGAARTNGGSGVLQGLRIKSSAGLTPTLWVYAWSKTPASTCTDKAAFVNSNTDSPYALPGFPMSVTLSNPGSWETGTYGQFTQLAMPFKNQDGSPGTAIYMCIVTAAAITPAATSDITAVAAGVQD